MRRLSLALLASIGLVAGLGQVASAADLGRGYNPPPPPPVVVSVFTWTGIYVGGNIGYGWGSSNGCDVFGCTDRKPSGFLGGGQIGFNYQFARNWVKPYASSLLRLFPTVGQPHTPGSARSPRHQPYARPTARLF